MKGHSPADERGEELKGLLTEAETEEVGDLSIWSRRRVVGLAIAILILILLGYFAHSLLSLPPTPAPTALRPNAKLHFNGDTRRSNGTHDFKRTVLIVSIDGMSALYLDRGLTPHLLDISKQGVRAKFMTPIFPTLTFPNHWALLTGLYAESHGIIANNFWDPTSGSEFHYSNAENSKNSSWWLGEPIWETAIKAGLLTANLMWPGPPETASGVSPTYYVPFKDKVPLRNKLDQLLQWIDLPLEQRPQLIMAYEPSLDQAGHSAGPNSQLVNETLKYVDVFAKDLHTALKDRNLTEIVDVIFVSDHGMADVSHPELVYIDDILGDGFDMIEHNDGWPSMGLRFREGTNTSHYLDILQRAANDNPDKFHVYTHETMPKRYHYSNNVRIAPIWVVPKLGYILTYREEKGVIRSKGDHGYDNQEPSMKAMFVAHGPFSMVSKDSLPSRESGLLSRRNKTGGWHSSSSHEAYIMEGFENVEIYGLLVKLLGLEGYAASTNGTAHFWDKYF